MLTIRLFVLISSCTLTISQQHSSSNKSPHPYNFAASNQRTRRLQSPIDQKRVSLHQYSRTSPTTRKQNSKKNGVPPYAVQMEPLVQYSQPDPLYTIEKQYISEAKSLDSPSNELVKKNTPGPMVADITEAESISRVGQITHARFRPPMHLSPPPPSRPHHHHHHHHHQHPPMREVEFSSYGTYYEGPPEAFEPPEPIIEIIIKESNESLPAPPPLPTPPTPKKIKEPVQVFYVKYKKEPGTGYGGEDKIVYDAPIPAVTPPANNEEHHEEHHDSEPVVESVAEDVTVPPPPSTTLKAIIRPDSETFDAKGVHITFGEPEEDHDPHHGELEQQSAPQPSIAFPNRTPKPSISRSSNGEVSTLTKRNPEPFNAPPGFQPNFPQPSAPTTFQQTPQFPPEDFQPPPLDPSQYSTLPQNLQFQRQQPQRYTTINNAPPPQQYHTINLPPTNVPTFQPFPQQQSFQPQRQTLPQDQHQRQVEQVNRLQHQQQLLQQQIAQQHRFQQQPPQTQFVQQPSLQQFPQQSSQQQFSQQPQFPQQPQFSQPRPQQNQQFQQNSPPVLPHQQFAQQPPTLQYHQSSDIVKSLEQPSNLANHRHEPVSTFAPSTPSPPPRVPTTPPVVQQYRTTTVSTTTTEEVTEIVTEDPRTVEKKKKQKEEQVQKNVANLPDEVPDDLREQLLSSGILGNADIQILDYDKIGDIPIENLPPEALANFQQATSGSQRVSVIRKPDSAQDREDEDSALSSSEYRPVTFTSANSDGDMEMKVVRFNPDEDEDVADRYMKKGATQLAPVVLNDNKYNRYLPLQVSGAQFPVPDVPELRGRNVTSVVVLAPVDYEFLNRKDDGSADSDARVGRSAAPVLEVQGVHFIAGDVLKSLVRMPSIENYRRWLEKEKKTAADKQSVVLLVLEPDSEHPEKEIFMYDISSGRVSKLRGELSSTFVQVAASNSHNQDLEEIADNPVAPGGDFTGSTS